MRACVLLALLLFALCRAQASESLLVMTTVWPPFRIEDEYGALRGLDIDVLDELSRRTGLRFELQQAPWGRGLAALQHGRADLMIGLARTPERERYIHYLPMPYYTCAPRFYAAPALAARLHRYEDLSGLEIGYVLQSAYFARFDSDRHLHKVGVTSERQLLHMLVRGRIDVLVGTDCQVDYALLDPTLAGRIAKAAYRPPMNTALYIGFSRQRLTHAEQLAEALKAMLEDGWIAGAARRYQVEHSPAQ